VISRYEYMLSDVEMVMKYRSVSEGNIIPIEIMYMNAHQKVWS
jgi:hypothetical protein